MTEKEERQKSGRGWFITFEGGEGTGKTTQIALLEAALKDMGREVIVTREPGGSAGGEAVRHVLLSGAAEKFGADMEAMLFAAARSDHVETVIRPALEHGIDVLCDRFFDSTRVYQGGAGGAGEALLHRLEQVACEDCWPDITVILDLDPEIGMQRADARRDRGATPDRFEKEDAEKQKRRRAAYLAIAEAEPERCVVVDASGDSGQVHERVLEIVRDRMRKTQPGWLNDEKVGRSA